MNAVTKTDTKAPRHVALAEYLTAKRADFVAIGMEDTDKFIRAVKNAIIKDPLIAEASTSSVFLECQKAAHDGLIIDGREAALVRFKTQKRWKEDNEWKSQWVMEVAYIPMVRGLRKLVSRSPQIASWHVAVVYKAEVAAGLFTYELGDSPSVKHKPLIATPDGDPVTVDDLGPVVAAYSVARLRDGSIELDVMRRDELDKIKARTKSKYEDKKTGQTVITGPWATDEIEMFKKTAARRHFKQLSLEGPAADAVERIDALYDFARKPDAEEFDLPAEPPAVTNARTKSVASRLKAADKTTKAKKGKETPHDPETGEIIDPDNSDAGDNGGADEIPDAEVIGETTGDEF